MMLRPIELHSAGCPRARQADQRRLNHMLIIEEIVTVRLVSPYVNTSAELRQNHDFYKFVLDSDGIPRLRLLLVRDSIVERQGIHFAATPLINAPLEEHRILVWRQRLIGGQHQRLTTNGNRAV